MRGPSFGDGHGDYCSSLLRLPQCFVVYSLSCITKELHRHENGIFDDSFLPRLLPLVKEPNYFRQNAQSKQPVLAV